MSETYRFNNNVDALVFLDTSAEQHALFVQAFELAKLRIEAALAADQLNEGTDAFCIISDLDETLLDNSAYNAWLVRYGRNFDEKVSWRDYCEQAISRPVSGATEFFAYVDALRDRRGNPIQMFYVTSRLNDPTDGGVRNGTVTNLRSLGYPLSDSSDDPTKTHLFMKGLSVPGQPGAKKYDHYAFIEQGRRRTPILWLGDNLSDFRAIYDNSVPSPRRLSNALADAEFGKRFITFPNPVYGSFLLTLRATIDGPVLKDDDKGAITGYAPAREDCTPDATPKMTALDVWSYDPGHA